MVSGFDRIVIAVPDLESAAHQYQQLLAVQPWMKAERVGEPPAAWFGLANTTVELVPGVTDRALIRGIVFSEPAAGLAAEPLPNSLGLDLRLCNGAATGDLRRQQCAAAEEPWSVDHLVLQTVDASRCIELFGAQLGIRLALDKTVPEWGGRMLFFRAGKLTLEVIESSGEPVEADTFWGIAYQCPDIERTARHLARRGVGLSAIRAGRKQGTRVAMISSHCLGIPSLLIEPAA